MMRPTLTEQACSRLSEQLEDHWMRNLLRWSAVLTGMLLVLAACTSTGSPSPSAAASAAASSAAVDPTAICAADAVGCVEVAPGDPIKIASALSITGDTAFLGNDSNFGIQVALDERGQLLGHDVQLVKEDAGCGDAASGQTAAQAIVADTSIVGVIGTTCSRTAVPAMPVLANAGLVMISPSNTAPSLTNPDKPDFGGPFYFRTAYNDNVQGAAVAKFACEQLHAKTAATIHDGSPYTEQLQQVFVDNFAEICNGETTDQEAVTPDQRDFASLLQSIATSNGGSAPEFFYYPIFTAAGALITQQARTTTGMEDTILAGADGLFNPDFLAAAGDAAEGMYLSGPDLAFSGDFYESTFKPEYTSVSGEPEPISVFHAHAYDAANMIMDAIESVAIEEGGSLFIPRTALRDAFFATSGYEGITGTLTCNEDGDCADAKISVSQVQDGAYVRIWP